LSGGFKILVNPCGITE